MSNITGRLEDVVSQDFGTGWILWGKVYDDIHKRFPDGARIHTSGMKLLEDDIAYTRNSIYQIGSWASPEAKEKAYALAKAYAADLAETGA